jgi:hypothetical protein
LALKNASQFEVIAAAVPALVLVLVLALDDVAGEVAADEVPAGADDPAGLGLLPPQAARVTVSATSVHAPTSCEMCP